METPEPNQPSDRGIDPAKLARRLRETEENVSLFVPAEVDEKALSVVRDHFDIERRKLETSPRSSHWRYWAAAAAFIALSAITVMTLKMTVRNSGVSHIAAAPAIPGDVDQNGRVDILDALALAETINSGTPRPATFDFNGDGRIDMADVDGIAQTAVQLPPEDQI